ncbi:glycoside hydrolase family 35 protein [Streptomyces fragilis]|uniref:beta-galactosidase n=1 Tax=Streptomyces fragilis TaxID=67301 RepID=A0ABV2YQN3_9ACTN|nr:beta-galactosidase [Streptomyces fragilis]
MVFTRRTFGALAGTAVLGVALAADSTAAPPTASASRNVPTGRPPAPPRADRRPHSVRHDGYSLIVDGQRLVLWSGEFHPFRLPSPSLWRDALQKIRASGHNAVTVPVAWNHHSPAPGRYDFTGVRDLGLLLRTAAEEQLYVVLRPGPFLGADLDAGGLPGWLAGTGGGPGADDPAYLEHVDAWLTAVDRIARRHQYTEGRGTVLLYQFTDVSGAASTAYREHLYAKVRGDGIEVPVFHKELDPSAGLAGQGPADVPPDRGLYFGAATSERSRPRTAGVLAEFTAGRPVPWGGGSDGRQAFEAVRRQFDAVHVRRTCLTDIANGLTVHNTRTAFGGTNWGWQGGPSTVTSYDLAAGHDEARSPTPQLAAFQQIGHMLRTVPDLAKLHRAADVRADDDRVRVYHLTNRDTGSHTYVLRNDSQDQVTTSLRLAGAGLPVNVTLPPRDARLIMSGLRLGERRLRHSTAQPMLFLRIGSMDVAVFTGTRGELVEVVLETPGSPVTTRLDPEPAWALDRNLLRVTAPLGKGGLSRVLVEGGGSSRPLLLILADEDDAARLWPVETRKGDFLVYGPSLVRTVTPHGSGVDLTGDVRTTTGLEVWAPGGIGSLTWNGERVRTTVSRANALVATRHLKPPPAVALPALTGWWRREENPEADPRFDDGRWRVADRTESSGATPVPEGQPVLFADDYGFHYGDLWYRGRVADARGVASVRLSYRAGPQGLVMAWLDGEPLGTHRRPADAGGQDAGAGGTDAGAADGGAAASGEAASGEAGTAPAGGEVTAEFAVPEELRTPGAHVLSVLVRPMAREEGSGSAGAHKAARGLTSVTFEGARPEVEWRLQGAAGADPVRGPLNNGGLYGEREGWHLPGPVDGKGWSAVELPAKEEPEKQGQKREQEQEAEQERQEERRQGVVWYRTAFTLDLPESVDASVGLALEDDPGRAYRVQIFLNGWNLGLYVNDVGPQQVFVLPNGVLRTRGENTLALAVLSDGTTPSGPGKVGLRLLGAAAGGTPVTDVDSPGR